MAFIQLEDTHGSREVIVFPRTYAKAIAHWQKDQVVAIKGSISKRDGSAKIIADSVWPLQPLAEGGKG